MRAFKGHWLLLLVAGLSILSACAPAHETGAGGMSALLGYEPPEGEPVDPTLLLGRPVGELPVVADFAWNLWASESTVGATLTWWLAITALGWLAWPLAVAAFGGLRDRGYLLSRSMALLFTGYLTWLPASLHWLENGLPLTLASVAVLLVVSVLLLKRYAAEMRAFLRHRWQVVLLGEVIFGVAYLAFVGIRILNPDLWQPWRGGEKAMDIAYLNACLRSAAFPPYDPYFAHGYLNYYYYGQHLVSILVRLTGIRSTVAFNLAVPTFFALTVCNAFSVGYTLAGRVLGKVGDRRAGFGIGHGLLAALCVAVLGNLASATQVIERLGWVSKSAFASPIPGLEALVKVISGLHEIVFHGVQFAGFNYWDPSRVVGPTINEFPYWSFLFADLHAHMMNIPFTLLVIAFALNWLLHRSSLGAAVPPARSETPLPQSDVSLVSGGVRRIWRQLDWGQAAGWATWPVALGALWAISSWDWPAYAGFSGLIVLIERVQSRGRRGIVPALLIGVTLAAGSLFLYLPFIRQYVAIHVGIGWGLARGYTLLGEFLTVWGLHLFLASSLLLILVVRQRSRWAVLRLARLAGRYPARLQRADMLYASLVREPRPGYRLSVWGVVGLAVLMAAWAWTGHWVLAFVVPLLALAAAFVMQARMTHERRFTVALLFAALLILAGVEFVYLKDHLDGGDAWRMNTLFKFYLQAWVMLGVALGASLPGIWQAVGRWQRGWRWLWTAGFGSLFVAASLYVVLGTPARVADRMPGARPPLGTLDGLAFMTVGTYYWPDENNPIPLWGDYGAIRWLQENVQGTPVLAEAPVWYYRDYGGRVSSYTGLPTLYNETHEGEQRYGWQAEPRREMAHELYRTPDRERTVEILRELRVEYVYIGPLERTLYPGAMPKFDQLASDGLLVVAYANDMVWIYRVR